MSDEQTLSLTSTSSTTEVETIETLELIEIIEVDEEVHLKGRLGVDFNTQLRNTPIRTIVKDLNAEGVMIDEDDSVFKLPLDLPTPL